MVGLIPACRLRESTAKLISADQIEIARLRSARGHERLLLEAREDHFRDHGPRETTECSDWRYNRHNARR